MPHSARTWIAVSFATAVTSTSFCAAAFCRTTTKVQPPDWDIVTQGCYDSSADPSAKPLFWQNKCVSYDVQKDASRQVSLDQATALVAAAFESWATVSCGGAAPSVSAVDLGPVDCATVEYNQAQPNQNVIVFRDDVWPYEDMSSTLGRTTVTYLTDTGEIVGADLEINGTKKLIVPMTTPLERERASIAEGYDLAAILQHEIGHFLGLAHSARADATMFATYQSSVRPLSDDDVAGICTVYPPNGARPTAAGPVAGAACDPTPRHGFSTACSTPGADRPDAEPASSSGGCGCMIASRRAGQLGALPAAALALACVARRRRVRRAALTM